MRKINANYCTTISTKLKRCCNLVVEAGCYCMYVCVRNSDAVQRNNLACAPYSSEGVDIALYICTEYSTYPFFFPSLLLDVAPLLLFAQGGMSRSVLCTVCTRDIFFIWTPYVLANVDPLIAQNQYMWILEVVRPNIPTTRIFSKMHGGPYICHYICLLYIGFGR